MLNSQPQLATATTNPKFKREVCRYWLQSRCLKGQSCEFLHAIDHSKMPMCPRGDACEDQDACGFKHPDDSRPICGNYQLGFCSFGRRCAHRHVQLPASELPFVSPYWHRVDPESGALVPGGPVAYSALQRASLMARTDNNFRRKPCEYFAINGWCPYFDMCNFKHGKS